jgi:hypothetical protein
VSTWLAETLVRFNIKMDLMEVVAGMRTGFLWVIVLDGASFK